MTHPFYIDESVAETGPVVRWESNNQVPFDDMLETFQKAGLITALERENSNRQRSVETAKFLAEYRANYQGPSEEERMEARAAFGPGVELVNAITGHSWRT